jgi:hypothetical protein
MTKKKIIGLLIAIVVIVVAWYLLSPLWRNMLLDEASPLSGVQENLDINKPIVKDNLDTMDISTRAEFDSQVEEMNRKAMPEVVEEMPSQARIIAEGEFKPRAHEIEGRALLIEKDGIKTLRFENFETINGPNLHIYLGSDLSDNDFVDLGKIRATSGNVNYEVDSSVDTTKYNKVLVWCVPFGVLFSYADLE